MAVLVSGIFKTREAAERAIDDLMRAGFSRDDISLLMTEATRGREFGLEMSTKAPEGAATGATVGAYLAASPQAWSLSEQSQSPDSHCSPRGPSLRCSPGSELAQPPAA